MFFGESLPQTFYDCIEQDIKQVKIMIHKIMICIYVYATLRINPRLKFTQMFWFLHFFTSVYFKTLEPNTLVLIHTQWSTQYVLDNTVFQTTSSFGYIELTFMIIASG